MPTPVAIDTDPGVDDAIALMLAMRSSNLRVELITTVAGNVPVRVATRNAKRLVALVDPAHWPTVSQGSAMPLSGPLRMATAVHGSDGLGGRAASFPVPRTIAARANAVDSLIEFVQRHGSQGVVVALGPLTNIAKAVERAPHVMAHLGRLVVMGGAIRVPGNASPVAEFNVFVDPKAADIVLDSGLSTVLVPLDVTRQVRLTRSHLASMGRGSLARAVKQITADGMQKRGHIIMHDALAVAIAMDPSLVGTESLAIGVETSGKRTRGMTVADLRESAAREARSIEAATSVDAERMLNMLCQCVSGRGARNALNAGRVVVVGSANMDLSIGVDTLPGAGETVLGRSMVQSLGGKGANQAVAARRAGASVSLIARVGRDDFGNEWLAFLAREGIEASGCTQDAAARTGIATITVSSSGENQIAVASGANARLTPRALRPNLARIAQADVLVVQLEIPTATTKLALETARSHGVVTILNPAPAKVLDDALLELVDVLVCNKVEAAMLTGHEVRSIAHAKTAAARLRARSIERVVVTLGEKGLVYLDRGLRRARHVAGKRVNVLDTTGAGDTFVGYLAAVLAQQPSLEPALELANEAGARSVTRRGAVPSIPTRDSLRSARRREASIRSR